MLCGIKKRYVENWEISRHEQFVHQEVTKEDQLCDDSEKYQVTIRDEFIASKFICDYEDEYRDWLETSLDEWMDRYDIEFEDLESKILITNKDLTNLEENIKFYEKTFLDHKKEMEDYVEDKRIRKLHNEMATKIQAWWRGTLVRKKLGPYRELKKGKKGKKGKKKSQGKKKI